MPGFEVFGEKEKQEIMEVLETGVLFRYEFGGDPACHHLEVCAINIPINGGSPEGHRARVAQW